MELRPMPASPERDRMAGRSHLRGLVSDTTVPFKDDQFVSIKLLLIFARCCFHFPSQSVLAASGGKSIIRATF